MSNSVALLLLHSPLYHPPKCGMLGITKFKRIKAFIILFHTFQINGLVAQLGERTVRIAEVEGSIPFESTISRKITAKSAVIFCLTTIIPQTGIISDHFTRPRAVNFQCSPLVILLIFD